MTIFLRNVVIDGITRFIMVGRLEAWRGFDLAIEAMAIAVKENSKLHLDILGKGTEKEQILQHIKQNATEDDKQVVTDLLDTLRANLDHCVGMAANMIGVKKNIIVVAAGPFQFAMINPVITGKSGAFQTEEGCLSLDGVRPCTRYKEIEVDYLDQNFKKKHGKYTGWTAQIIQHEVDHCNGVVI